MQKQFFKSALVATLLCAGTSLVSQANAQVFQNPANGHYYEAVAAPTGISWTDARTAAKARTHNGLSGHLVTITSAAEQSFIASKLPSAISNRYIIGGLQSENGAEPGGGWGWVTGEPWSYTNWSSGEPNNVNGMEEILVFEAGGGWNDAFSPDPFNGYVVEYEATSPSLRSITMPLVDVYGGRPMNVTVTLSAAAPAGGAVITLTNTNPGATVPPTVTIPAGKNTVTFVMTTQTVTTLQTGTLTATYAGNSTSLDYTVHRIRIKVMTLSPNTLYGGQSGNGVIVLEAPTPVALEIRLSSSNTATATVPATITIPAGAFLATFPVKAKAVAATANTFITARAGGAAFSEKLVVFVAK